MLILTSAIAACGALLPALGRHAEVHPADESAAVLMRRRLRQRKDVGHTQYHRSELTQLNDDGHRSRIGTKAIITLEVATQKVSSAMAMLNADAAAIRSALVAFGNACTSQLNSVTAKMTLQNNAITTLQNNREKNLQNQGKLAAEVTNAKSTADSNLLSYQAAVSQKHQAETKYQQDTAASTKQSQALDGIIQALEAQRQQVDALAKQKVNNTFVSDTSGIDYVIGAFTSMKNRTEQDSVARSADHQKEQQQMTNLVSSTKTSSKNAQDAYNRKRLEKLDADVAVRDDHDETEIRGIVVDGKTETRALLRDLCRPSPDIEKSEEAGRILAAIGDQDKLLGSLQATVQSTLARIDTLPDLDTGTTFLATKSHTAPYIHGVRGNFIGVASHANFTRRARQSYTPSQCASLKQQYAADLATKQKAYYDAKIEADLKSKEVTHIVAMERIQSDYKTVDLVPARDYFASKIQEFEASTQNGFRSVAAKADIDAAVADVENYRDSGGPSAADLLLDMIAIKLGIDTMVAGTTSAIAGIKTSYGKLMPKYQELIGHIDTKAAELNTRKLALETGKTDRDAAVSSLAGEVQQLQQQIAGLEASCT